MFESVLLAATAFVGARVLPVEGAPIERGVLVIDGAKIVAVGPEGSTSIPAGARRVDLSGKTLIPGLVDTHSHVGGVAGADGSAPIQPDVSVGDSVNPFDPGFRRVVAGGITTMNVMPGSGHLLSGKTVYLKPKPAKTLDAMQIRDGAGNALGGLKMANGTNSQRENPPFPGTRGKSAALVREKFVAAQEYRDKLARAKGDPEKAPARDLGLETLVEVLDGKRVVHHHTHRADDILTVLRLQKEFGFKVVLQHVSEAWKVTDEIKASGAGCSAILVDSPGGKLETRDLNLATGRILEQAGILTAWHTDDWITDSRLFLRMGAIGVRYGMTREGSLAALTLNGAKLLDLDARVGSLKAGKDADFVVLSGDPFSSKTEVLETWIEGEKVFDRSVPDDRLHAEGGYGAGNPMKPYLCCADEVAQ
ncbi:MAG TPA: amidohydrolase family protein [Candidatus Polarisedimenticolaceae bacterium]